MAASAKEPRIYLWDNLKFFLITLVVMGHFAAAFTDSSENFRWLYICIYSVHMPLFIFISGLFSKSTVNNKSKLKKRVIFFIFCGFLSKMINAVSLLLFQPKIIFSLLSDGAIPWFLFALAAFFMITSLTRNVKPSYVLIFAVLLAFFTGYDNTVRDYLYLSRIVVFFPFFYAGYLINPESLRKKVSGTGFRIASAVILVAFPVIIRAGLDVTYKLRPLLTGHNPYVNQTDGFLRLLCYAISVITGLALISLTPNIRIPFITDAGKRTLQPYLLHHMFLRTFLIMPLFSRELTVLPDIAFEAVFLILGVLVTFLLSANFFSFMIKWQDNLFDSD